jgi:MoaA/NifB/PqqE/SkfB family radical SAM enzyme
MNIEGLIRGTPNLITSIIGTSKAPPPVYMQIEPTSRCNLSCKMCFRNECPYELNKDLSLEYFKKIINKFNLKQIHLTGFGEPFLNKKIFDMIEYASNSGAQVEITTNGTLLNKRICERIISSKLRKLNVSLDGIETYEEIRGVSITRALKAIENLANLKTGNGPELFVNTVVLKDNLEDLKNVVDALASFPVTLNLKTNRPTKNYARVEIGKAVHDAIKRAGVKGLNVNYIKYIPTPFCYRIYFGGYVNTEGKLFVCCDLFKPVGNILDDAWNSQEFQEFRRRFKNGFPRECNVCNLTFNQKVHRIFGWLK